MVGFRFSKVYIVLMLVKFGKKLLPALGSYYGITTTNFSFDK